MPIMRPRSRASRSARAPGPSKSATTRFRPPPRAAPPGLLKAFSGGTGSGAIQGRVVNGALVAECLYRHHHDGEKVRNHPPRARQWRGEGFFDRAGAAGRSRPHRRHRCAAQERARSHDRLDAARARQCRAAVARCLPHRCGHFRRPAALRPEARFQAHGNRQGRARLSRARRWSARSISRRSRAISPIAP